MRYTDGAPNKLYVVVDDNGYAVCSMTNLVHARNSSMAGDVIAVYTLERIARKPKVVRD